jgi:hypothetical protein
MRVKLTYRGFLSSLTYLHQYFGISIVLTSTHTEQSFSQALSELQTFLVAIPVSKVSINLIPAFFSFKRSIIRGLSPRVKFSSLDFIFQILSLLIKEVSFIKKCNLIKSNICFDPCLSCLDIISPLPRDVVRYVLISTVFGVSVKNQVIKILKDYPKVVKDYATIYTLVKEIKVSFYRTVPTFLRFIEALYQCLAMAPSIKWSRPDGAFITIMYANIRSSMNIKYGSSNRPSTNFNVFRKTFDGRSFSFDPNFPLERRDQDKTRRKTRNDILSIYCRFIYDYLVTEVVSCADSNGIRVYTDTEAFIVSINDQQDLIKCYNMGILELISINASNFETVYSYLGITTDLTEEELRLIKSSTYSLVSVF